MKKKQKKKKISKIILTAIKRKAYELDDESIAYYRRNPVIAAEDLLGVKLLDSQAIILQRSWNCPHVLWTCCRNFGKSFLGAIFISIIAAAPNIFTAVTGLPETVRLGGTSILIAVGVVLETYKQLESSVASRNYNRR